MIGQYFSFNGVNSATYNLQIVRLDSGMFELPFICAKSIIEDSVNRKRSPYFYGVKYEPITFTLTFTSLTGAFTTTELYNIASWLFTDTYKPFISDESPTRVLYCMAISDSKYVTTGAGQGYFTVEFRARDPYFLTLAQTTTFDLSANTTDTTVQLTNTSNTAGDYYYAELQIGLLDTTTAVTIYNLSDSNRKFELTGLSLLETVYVDNAKKIIVSSTGNNRIGNLTNKVWLRLVRGVNNLKVVGKCSLQFRCQFPIVNS